MSLRPPGMVGVICIKGDLYRVTPPAQQKAETDACCGLHKPYITRHGRHHLCRKNQILYRVTPPVQCHMQQTAVAIACCGFHDTCTTWHECHPRGDVLCRLTPPRCGVVWATLTHTHTPPSLNIRERCSKSAMHHHSLLHSPPWHHHIERTAAVKIGVLRLP